MAAPAIARAQGVDGYVSLMADVLPDVGRETGERDDVSELAARLFAERRFTFAERFRITLAGFAEGLVADRAPRGATRAAIVRPQEMHLEARWAKADLRVGLSRVVWGRLDELLPTDVVNPLDVTRFFLEGRSEARMPVGMIRARLLPSDRFAIEAIYVPIFRRGRFDQLDETSSAFNLAPQTTCASAVLPPCLPLAVVSQEPKRTWGNAQGGARASITTGRVDWSIATYRGFETLPLFEVAEPPALQSGPPAIAPKTLERFPPFTMIGGDFETVRGAWGVRGEVALFVDRTLQTIGAPVLIQGRMVDGGIGVDRKAGAYRVSGNVVIAKRWSEAATLRPDLTSLPPLPTIDHLDLTLVATVDRSFVRETRTLRAFAVYNPGQGSAFARVIATFVLRDNVSFEASGGWFTGEGVDLLSRLATRDFVYARLKVFF